MVKFILRRLLQAIPTLLVLSALSFFMMRLAPGNPFNDERGMPPEILANIEAAYGLDKPLHEQYLRYMSNLLHGDLGPSFKYRDFSVNYLVEQAFPVSIKIGICAFIIAVCLGVSAGVVAALRQNSWCDHVIMLLAMVGVVLPSFVKAPLLMMIFAVWLKWLPAGGWNGGPWNYMLLPVVSLAIAYVASIARITRASMIEVLNANFIRTAQAKGLPMRHIVWHHALKPAMLPVIAYLAPAFVGIMTGSMVVETIFGLPGIGQLFVNGSLNRDYSMVMSLTLIVGALTILFTAIADILYAAIDPKIRY